MADHLRFAGQSDDAQRAALVQMLRDEPVLMEVLRGLREEALPQGMLVAGAIYNMVWNRLTGRPGLTGINDIDVFYFDDSDIGYDAEDVAIKRLDARLGHLPLPVQVRNQARVHLWFPQKFGADFAPLSSSEEMLGRYASKTHAVAAQLQPDDSITLFAPFGLDDIFSFRITPNHVLPNRMAHDAKGARAKSVWPELTVYPWD